MFQMYIVYFFIKYYLGDQIKENVMGRTCRFIVESSLLEEQSNVCLSVLKQMGQSAKL